jgi:hypothetical protein
MSRDVEGLGKWVAYLAVRALKSFARARNGVFVTPEESGELRRELTDFAFVFKNLDDSRPKRRGSTSVAGKFEFKTTECENPPEESRETKGAFELKIQGASLDSIQLNRDLTFFTRAIRESLRPRAFRASDVLPLLERSRFAVHRQAGQSRASAYAAKGTKGELLVFPSIWMKRRKMEKLRLAHLSLLCLAAFLASLSYSLRFALDDVHLITS